MTVVWQGEPNEAYLFEWGLDSTFPLGSSTPSGDPGTSLIQVKLSGLIPATHYLYRISTLTAEVQGSFVTPPVDSNSLIFFAFGDTRSGPETLNEISASILQYVAANPSAQTFVISTGDLMDTATEESLQENLFASDQIYNRSLMATMPVVNIMGNHDGTAYSSIIFHIRILELTTGHSTMALHIS
jgi:phosphodiesterase/alkaline phosphatase D-like protein